MLQQMKNGIQIKSVMLRPELIERESVREISCRELPKEEE